MIYLSVIDSTAVNTSVIVGAGLLVGVFTLIRGRADVWKSNYEGEKTRADDLQLQVTKLTARVAELESQPNITKLYDLIAQHDKDSAAQNLKITQALDRVVTRLKGAK
jgi:hypothetical protein